MKYNTLKIIDLITFCLLISIFCIYLYTHEIGKLLLVTISLAAYTRLLAN